MKATPFNLKAALTKMKPELVGFMPKDILRGLFTQDPDLAMYYCEYLMIDSGHQLQPARVRLGRCLLERQVNVLQGRVAQMEKEQSEIKKRNAKLETATDMNTFGEGIAQLEKEKMLVCASH